MHKNNLLDDCGHLPEERWQQNVSLYSVIQNVSLYSVIIKGYVYSQLSSFPHPPE